MHRVVKPTEHDEKYLLLCSHLKFKYSYPGRISIKKMKGEEEGRKETLKTSEFPLLNLSQSDLGPPRRSRLLSANVQNK